MKKSFLLLAALLFTGNYFAQTYSKEIEDQISKVETGIYSRIKVEGESTNILERMAYYKVKGLSVAVIQNYKVIWAKGYGWADEKDKRPVTTETLFEPGSISKSLNAVGILKLAQDKKLDLNVDINTYLRSWKFPYDTVSHGKKITLANLLSHTAGLSVHGFPGYDRKEKIPTVPEILDGKRPANTGPVRSEFEPGLRFQYSGGGTTISQLILTDVTQQAYDKFIYENVFKPMGMESSFYTQPAPTDKFNLLATGYKANGKAVEDKFHVYPEQGAAGLWTTPSDLCKYIIESQLAYEGKSSKVLNQEMTKLRMTPYLNESVALGVFIEEVGGVNYFGHGARNEGFSGQYFGSLQGGNGVVVFVNGENDNIGAELINSIATVYKWKDFFYIPVSKKTVKVPEDIMQKYVGLYQVNANTVSIIVKKEDGYYQYSDGMYNKMYFTSNETYFIKEAPNEKHFMFDGKGSVTGYVRILDGKKLPPHLRISVDTLTGSEEFVNSLGWSFLENKDCASAKLYLERGAKLYPSSLMILGNLAHSYLFCNQYAKAVEIYKAHLNEKLNEDISWKKMMEDDFIYFKNEGYDKELMNKIFVDLKLEVPEEFK